MEQTPKGQTVKRPGRTEWRRWGPLAALVAAAAVSYWPVLSGAGVIFNDFVEQYFPYRIFAATALKGGEFPFWNPYVFGGMPFFADLQTAVLYPLNLLLTIFASRTWLSPLVVEYQIVLHVVLAGACMYWFARELGCGRAAALVAGLVFMLGGFTTTHIFHVTMIHALPWFPLAAGLLRRTLERGSLLSAALGALVLAMAALAGHPQLLMYLYYWLGAYFVFHCVTHLRGRGPAKALVRPAILFALMVALGAGMSAVQLAPAAKLGEASERPEMEFSRSCEGSFRPYRFVTLIAPNYFGTPNNYYRKSESAYWGFSERDIDAGGHYYWETAMYVGVSALALAVLAAVAVRTPLALFLAGAGFVALLLAMGDSFFLYGLCYKLLPGFSRFRLPGRFASLFALSMAPLAGLGVQWLMERGGECSPRMRKGLTIGFGVAAGVVVAWALLMAAGGMRAGVTETILSSGVFGSDQRAISEAVEREIYPAAVGSAWLAVLMLGATVAVVLIAVRGKMSGRAAGIALPLIVFVDLLAFGAGYAAMRLPPSKLFVRTSLVRELQQQGAQELFRINMRDSRPGTDDAGGRNMVFHKNQGSVHRLFLMEGYNPLRLRRKFLNRKETTLDILNVKYAINVDPATGRLDPRYPLRQRTGYLPRAWMVHRWEVAPDTGDSAVMARLYASDFDHRTTALLEQAPALDQAPDSGASGTARITHYGLNRVRVDVETSRPGLLMLSEIHYPEWKALVDKREAPLYRADYALRAIPVPAGRHTVECVYSSAAFRKGLWVSLAALAVTIAAGALGWRRERMRVQNAGREAAA